MQELLEWMEYIEDTRQQRKVRHTYELWEGVGQIQSTSGAFFKYTADSSGGVGGK